MGGGGRCAPAPYVVFGYSFGLQLCGLVGKGFGLVWRGRHRTLSVTDDDNANGAGEWMEEAWEEEEEARERGELLGPGSDGNDDDEDGDDNDDDHEDDDGGDKEGGGDDDEWDGVVKVKIGNGDKERTLVVKPPPKIGCSAVGLVACAGEPPMPSRSCDCVHCGCVTQCERARGCVCVCAGVGCMGPQSAREEYFEGVGLGFYDEHELELEERRRPEVSLHFGTVRTRPTCVPLISFTCGATSSCKRKPRPYGSGTSRTATVTSATTAART